MLNKNKLLVFIVTYNSSFRLKKILNKLEHLKKKIKFDVLISDDCSQDDTMNYAVKKKYILIHVHKKNMGYGGNVKFCLDYAIKNNYDYAVMIHGDNQYDCRYIDKLYKKINTSNADAVTGSRMMKPSNALNGKMPIYKFFGNIILTKIFNYLFNTNFTDAHTGLWIYNLLTVKFIGLKKLDNGFNFDNQLRMKLINLGKKIIEIPIKTYYRNERSSFHIIYAIKFILELFKEKIRWKKF